MGHARLDLLGATTGGVLRCSWRYPTGTELKEAKFAGPGPWHDVDWALLRRKTSAVLKLLKGPLGGIAPVGERDTFALASAVTEVRSGERKITKYASVGTLVLPE